MPVWYLYDQYQQWAERALGTGWATSMVMVDSMRFYSANRMEPMAGKITSKPVPAGTLFNIIKRERDKGAASASFCIDITARDL